MTKCSCSSFRFGTIFSHDSDSMPRVWTGKEDIRAITKAARSAVRSVSLLTFCYISLEQSLKHLVVASCFLFLVSVLEVAFSNGCDQVG